MLRNMTLKERAMVGALYGFGLAALSLGASTWSSRECGPGNNPKGPPVLKETNAYSDMGEGIYSIPAGRTFQANLAAWQKDHPNLEITAIIPHDDVNVEIKSRERP